MWFPILRQNGKVNNLDITRELNDLDITNFNFVI